MKLLKMLAVGLLVAVVMGGCMSEKAYMTGKVIYKGAKTVYVELPYESEKLEVLDKVVVTYDKARTTVKEEIEAQKEEARTKQKKSDASSLKAQEQ